MASSWRAPPQDPGRHVFQTSDGLLVCGLIAVLAMLVLPLPPWLIDGLVGLNIAMGLLLLLAALHVNSPLELSAFPGILLVSTLFRLALSIATTRQILLQGHAGHVIDAFGQLVAGGHLLVGLVVFSIITVVQFIVVAKGAERVAEVAARFTLDALPGKQMAIDADLRSGLIDKDEARRRRRDLERESKLHGSLDGAMKFVKGDTLASIFIIVINGLGGLAIGVGQMGLSLPSALSRYSILSIGEGMVAQLPALMSAMAAGLIVTRSGDHDGDRHLGDTIARQFGAKPRVMLFAAGVCLWLACVPGFPAWTFMSVGSALALGGVWGWPKFREWAQHGWTPAQRFLGMQPATPATALSTAEPTVRTAPTLTMRLTAVAFVKHPVTALLKSLEHALARANVELGLLLPPIILSPAVDGVDEAVGSRLRWSLEVRGTPVAQGVLDEHQLSQDLEEATWQALRRHTSLFLGVQETSALLARTSLDSPELVREVLRTLPVQRVAEVLRRLIDEGVSLHPMRDILEALGDAAQREKDLHALTELTRLALRRQINHQAAPDNRLKAVLLLPPLEDALRQSLHSASGSPQTALEPAMAREILRAVQTAVRACPTAAIVASLDIRRPLRKLIEAECFDTPVLSFHELMPSLQWEVVARLGLPESKTMDAA
jgi:type III secretion protein V